MNPSDLPWWGWLLCAGLLLFAAFISFLLGWNADAATEWNRGHRRLLLAAVLCVAGLLSGLLGVVRFVKWAWAG
jgi:hypothetical protein